MINAGTVGAYLELDISQFTANLSTAGQMLERFRQEHDDDLRGSDGLGSSILRGLTSGILEAGSAVAAFVRQFGSASESVRNDAEMTGGAVGGLGKHIQTAAQAASKLYSDEIRTAASGVAEAVQGVSSALAENGDSWNTLAKQQESCGVHIRQSAVDASDAVCNAFGGLPDATRSYVQDAWSGMKSELDAGRPALFAAARNDGDGILGGFDSALGGMRGIGGSAVNALRKGMEDRKPAAESTASGIMNAMRSAAGAVSFSGIGGNIVSGILKGINEKKPSLISAATSLAASAAAAAKRTLGIHSPSKVMMELGRYTAEGMEIGLRQGSKNLYRTASAISEETAASLSGISMRGLNIPAHTSGTSDRLDRLLDAVEKLASSRTTMEIDGRCFGRLVRAAELR